MQNKILIVLLYSYSVCSQQQSCVGSLEDDSSLYNAVKDKPRPYPFRSGRDRSAQKSLPDVPRVM